MSALVLLLSLVSAGTPVLNAAFSASSKSGAPAPLVDKAEARLGAALKARSDVKPFALKELEAIHVRNEALRAEGKPVPPLSPEMKKPREIISLRVEKSAKGYALTLRREEVKLGEITRTVTREVPANDDAVMAAVPGMVDEAFAPAPPQ